MRTALQDPSLNATLFPARNLITPLGQEPCYICVIPKLGPLLHTEAQDRVLLNE